MLTVLPAPRVSDEEAAVRVASHLAWPGWERFSLGACSAFHLLLAGALLFAPDHQVYNAGTKPIFDLAPRWLWGLACLSAGVTALLVLHRPTMLRQMATWYVVIPLGSMWSGTFLLALVNGYGSAIGAVVFPFLYLWFATAAFRISIRKR